MTSTNFNSGPITGVVHGEKPEKFWWCRFQTLATKKMLFYLTTLNLAKFLIEDAPILPEGEKLTKKSNLQLYLCKNYILNGLDNALYNVYSSVDSTKKISELH